MKNHFLLLLYLVFFSVLNLGANEVSCLQKIRIPRNADLTDYINKDAVSIHYIINDYFDLSNYSRGLTVGENCKLEFIKGGFINGRLYCKSITIEGRKPDFRDVYIVVRDAKVVKLKNITATYTNAMDDFVRITNSNNIEIEKVKIVFDEGNRQKPNGDYIEAEGFDLTNCKNVRFSKCSIYNAKSHYADSEHGSLTCKNCRDIIVDDCFSSGGHNEIFNFINCFNLLVKNSTVKRGRGSAIATQGGENIDIDHCTSIDVLASGFSFNSKNVRITNCIAKDWHEFNGITLGHPADGARASDVVVSNCKLLLSDIRDSHKKCAFGGVVDGTVVISNCQTRTSRICSFDGVYRGQEVSLTFDNNYFNCFEGDTFAETFRASGILDLVVSHNTFVGNANITGFIKKIEGSQPSNWRINGNTFKKLKNVAVLPPGVKDNTSDGVFEFCDNVIESADVSTLRYFSGKQMFTDELIAVPQYAKRVISKNLVKGLKGGKVKLFRARTNAGMETEFTGNYINSRGIKEVLIFDKMHNEGVGSKLVVRENTLLKGAELKGFN